MLWNYVDMYNPSKLRCRQYSTCQYHLSTAAAFSNPARTPKLLRKYLKRMTKYHKTLNLPPDFPYFKPIHPRSVFQMVFNVCFTEQPKTQTFLNNLFLKCILEPLALCSSGASKSWFHITYCDKYSRWQSVAISKNNYQ